MKQILMHKIFIKYKKNTRVWLLIKLNVLLICSLQEEILRLRMVNDASKKETSAAFQNPYSPPQLAQQQLPVKYIVIAIAMALFGLILGKFVLWINDLDRNVTATASVDDAGVKNVNHQQWKIQKKNKTKSYT